MKMTKTEIKVTLKALLDIERRMIDNDIKVRSFIDGLMLIEHYGKYSQYSNIPLWQLLDFLENNWDVNRILDEKLADYIGESIAKRVTKKETC